MQTLVSLLFMTLVALLPHSLLAQQQWWPEVEPEFEATFWFAPAFVDDLEIGDVFKIDVWVDFGDRTTIGGGFSIDYDDSVLNAIDWQRANLGDPGFSREPEFVPGRLSGIAFGDFTTGLSGAARVGTATFVAQADGFVRLVPHETGGLHEGFVGFDDFQPIRVKYNHASIALGDSVPLNSVLQIEPPEIDFRWISLQHSAAYRTTTISVSNEGRAELSLGPIGKRDQLDSPFRIIEDHCSFAVLTTGNVCNIRLQFSQHPVGRYRDTFDVPAKDPAATDATVIVSGEIRE